VKETYVFHAATFGIVSY